MQMGHLINESLFKNCSKPFSEVKQNQLMKDPAYTRLQIIVFILATTSFTNIYLTQPILPVLKEEFGVDLVQVSFTMSAVIGIFMGPLAGRISNRFDSGSTLIGATILLSLSLILMLLPSLIAITAGLLILSVGFFTIHATAVGALNQKVSKGQGRANALYVLFYYIGAGVGITATGYVYKHEGWSAMIYLCLCFAVVPLYTGISELKNKTQESDVTV